MLWNYRIQADNVLEDGRSNIVALNKKKGRKIVNFTDFGDQAVKSKE